MLTDYIRWFRTPALSVLMVAATLYIIFGRLPGDTLLWREIQNTGHTLVFILITLVCYVIMRNRAVACRTGPKACYLLVFSAAASIAVATEFAQMLTGRNPSALDLVRDLSGSLIGIFILYLNDVRTEKHATHGFTIAGTVFVLCALITASLYPLGRMSIAYSQRNSAMPVIFEPAAEWMNVFMRLKDAHVSVPAGRTRTAPKRQREMAQVSLLPSQYPGVTIIEPYPDWTEYRTLLFEIHSGRAEDFYLILRIHDESHNFALHDRFNTRLIVQPGHNRFVIPLESVRNAPGSRKMDMKRIRDVTLFASSPDGILSFMAGPMRLE